ncbi:unnamed protein product [Effrenium voratum]|uniref:Uncharacterized protein n=1 Tax=Effrenium voratum TaxID=2562239 RepID=A0AA36HZS0_9DINO|nr:unnamed protein product [Effrenium voratum]
MPENSRLVEADYHAHKEALDSALHTLRAAEASRLRHMDATLETEALWPPCRARVALAEKLQKPRAIQRRCQRYLLEVIIPLAEGVCSKHWADDPSKEALRQARDLVSACSSAWLEAMSRKLSPEAHVGEASVTRRAWLHMLHRSGNPRHKEVLQLPEKWQSWLASLRQAHLARLCPSLDMDALQRFLQTISLASPVMQEVSTAPPVIVPLGLFTVWQALVLVALARREGRHALVVRRQAAGTPQVLFRTSSAVLSTGQ